MPTYLVHGFRWDRPTINIHIVRYDLEDAATDWIMAPATAITLLNSFYTLFDFLPPSNPPPASYPLPAPHAEVVVQDEVKGPRRLAKKRSSLSSSFSLRQARPSSLSSAAILEQKGQNGNSGNVNGTRQISPDRPSNSTGSSTSTLPRKPGEKAPKFNDWSVVKLLEQYDLNDLETATAPYAYVGDYMIEIATGISIEEETKKYEAMMRAEEEACVSSPGEPGTAGQGLSARDIRRKSRRLGWFEKLRDGLHKGADIGWFVVVCGDEERDTGIVEDASVSTETGSEEDVALRTPKSAGLRGFFGRKKNGVAATAEE
ncbi:hypothetical protein G7Y89_g13718 [Cudoniella acicularis]|uniref:Developmental regulator protein n=1 Tax=Cudoniella acicularis TaxID=354080 RepID=A0A8H4VXY9_9HELO|nr:hypothetical protein G7Y89_g13718 [Cudoniella acicularis]